MTLMTWEYRVMVRGDELAIYEVYYYEDGRTKGYSATPVFPVGENIDELRAYCDLYVAALSKPILKYQD
jgi:hypothetical protein